MVEWKIKLMLFSLHSEFNFCFKATVFNLQGGKIPEFRQNIFILNVHSKIQYLFILHKTSYFKFVLLLNGVCLRYQYYACIIY